MKPINEMSLSELNNERRRKSDLLMLLSEPEVTQALNIVKKRNAPIIVEIDKRIAELRSSRKKTARIPEGTPPKVIAACREYWLGTEELEKYRIHGWTSDLVWTSYAAGSFSTNGGRVTHTSGHYIISMKEVWNGKPKVVLTMEGAQKRAEVMRWMEDYTKGKK